MPITFWNKCIFSFFSTTIIFKYIMLISQIFHFFYVILTNIYKSKIFSMTTATSAVLIPLFHKLSISSAKHSSTKILVFVFFAVAIIRNKIFRWIYNSLLTIIYHYIFLSFHSKEIENSCAILRYNTELVILHTTPSYQLHLLLMHLIFYLYQVNPHTLLC